MKMTKTKLYMAGISITLAWALSGCGTEGNSINANTSSYETLGKDSRTVTRPTTNSRVIASSITENSVMIGYDFDDTNPPQDTVEWHGFTVAVVKLPFGTTQAEVDGMSFYDFNCSEAFYTHVKTDRNITAYNLDSNSTYAFIPGAFLKYLVGGVVPKTDTLCGSAVVATTNAKIPTFSALPCLEGKSACVYNAETCDWVYGAKLKWCLPKKLNAVNIYREELDMNDNNNTISGTFETLATDVIDKRKYQDVNVNVDSLYRYTVEGYNSISGIYSESNATLDILIESE